jgi:3-deoxy-D-manno-oct-2-ulosonic acid (Kdo) hydroxylase
LPSLFTSRPDLLYVAAVDNPGGQRLVDLSNAKPQESAAALENGNILFCRETPFELSSQDREELLGVRSVPGAHHKNIAFKPDSGKVTGLSHLEPRARETVARVLKAYSEWTICFAADLLPGYARDWHIDYTSFRPVEEESRDLPWKKRNDLIHTDAFPSRPTYGGLILRVFTNINPAQERVWVVGDPFAALAKDHAVPAGLMKFAEQSQSPGWKAMGAAIRVARAAGLPAVDRSPYDRFMLAFHDYLKASSDFQLNAAKYRLSFPPNSTWLVFTDVVPHSVLSGQYALEQTFIVSPGSLSSRDRAPIAILERMSKTRLAGV